MPEDCPIITITVSYRVTEPDRLIAFAAKRYLEAWDHEERLESLEQAVYEAMLGSNLNPDLSALGLEEIRQHYQHVDGPTIDITDAYDRLEGSD